MPIFKFFLYVGSLLSLLLFAWSVYLEPPTDKAQATPPPVKLPEVFRPTPAPPIVEAKRLPVAGTPPSAKARSSQVAKVVPAKQKKKQRVQMARRPAAPDRSFAYFPQSPFFVGWRQDWR
jgi:hypothetical protein